MPYCFSMTLWPAFAVAIVAGLILGSFLNVCIARLPRHESIVKPRSHCLACGIQIRASDNIPLLSWINLRGRCRHCRQPISIQYPLVELGTTLLFCGCVFQTAATWQTILDAAACFFLLGLLAMDWQTMLLPDSFTLTGLALAFVLQVCAPGLHDRAYIAWKTLAEAALAAALLLIVLCIYWLVRRRQGIGWGDVKLLAMIAAFLGLPSALFAYFFGVVGAAAFAVILIARRRARGFDRIPFGTFLAGAGILAVFVGTPVLTWYLNLFR